MKYALIIIFISTIHFEAKCQKNSFIAIGYDNYFETKHPFTFKKEDNSRYKYSRGNFINIAYLIKLNKRISVNTSLGLGYFKPHKTMVDTIEFTSSSILIPICFKGELAIIKSKFFTISLIAGLGLYRDNHRMKLIQNEHETLVKSNFGGYTYGAALDIYWRGLESYPTRIAQKITSFNDYKFIDFGFVLPIIQITKEK